MWKKLIPTLIDDFEGLKTSAEEVTADVVQRARELELEVEPEDVTELLPSHDKGVASFEWFLEMEFNPGDDVVKTVEMTTKNLLYLHKLSW